MAPAVAMAWPERNRRVPHETSFVRTGEIKALSGLRIVAAVWVVLFHFRPLLEQAAPGFRSALAPVLNCGAQGVDLFFILSGFVLTWTYLDRMGDSWSTRATLHFLWLRLARVWPVYLVTLHLAAAWIIFTLYVGHEPSKAVDQLNAVSYVRQVFLVQLWFQPYFDGSSWDGPAWSISAEWLAYLLFGVLGAGDLPHRPRDQGPGPAVVGVGGVAAAGTAPARDGSFLHAVELAPADRHAVHRGRAGLRRGAQDAALRPSAPWRRLPVRGARRGHRRHSLLPRCASDGQGATTRAGSSTCCSCRWSSRWRSEPAPCRGCCPPG